MLGYSSLASILTFSHLPGELLFIIQEQALSTAFPILSRQSCFLYGLIVLCTYSYHSITLSQ